MGSRAEFGYLGLYFHASSHRYKCTMRMSHHFDVAEWQVFVTAEFSQVDRLGAFAHLCPVPATPDFVYAYRANFPEGKAMSAAELDAVVRPPPGVCTVVRRRRPALPAPTPQRQVCMSQKNKNVTLCMCLVG